MFFAVFILLILRDEEKGPVFILEPGNFPESWFLLIVPAHGYCNFRNDGFDRDTCIRIAGECISKCSGKLGIVNREFVPCRCEYL